MLTLIMTLTAQANPDFATLDTTPWKEVGKRRTDVGEVAIRASYVDAIGCVEGTTNVAVPPDALLAITADMASAKEWSSADLTLSEVVDRDEGSFVLFQLLNVPAWTLSADRYWVIEGTPEVLDSGSQRYRWHRVSAASYPEVADQVGRAIEPPVNYGEWLFTQTDAGTELRYRSCADFGGRLPASLQRWVNTQQLPALVSDLVKEASRRDPAS